MINTFIPVSVDYVRSLHKRLQEINSVPFENIIWLDSNAFPIDIPKDKLNDWKFIGLNNTSFVDFIDED